MENDLAKNKVYIIGAGFSKATCNAAPLGREFLKFLEDTYDSYEHPKETYYYLDFKKEFERGRKASSHFRDIVNNFHNRAYSAIFAKPQNEKDIDWNLPSQYDLEMVLSLLAINHEIFRRSNIGYSDELEIAFYDFVNWSILQTLSPIRVSDELKLAEKFCHNILDFGDTVITFNYDLILDKVLYEEGLWYPLSKKGNSYSCACWDSYLDLPQQIKKVSIDQLAGKSSINFIKIHGSINWFSMEGKPDMNNLYTQPYRDIAKIFNIENGHCYFKDDLKINPAHYIPEHEYFDLIRDLCVVKPTLGKVYLKTPFSNLVKNALSSVAKSDELYLIGYSLPIYDTLSEFLLLNLNPQCEIKIINLGDESHKLKEKIVNGTVIDWDKVNVFDQGVRKWLYES